MKAKKFFKALKKAAEYFSAGVGAVSFLFIVVGAFVVVPPIISLPIAGGVGLILGCFGGFNTASEVEEHDKRTQHVRRQRSLAAKEVHEMKLELDELKQELAHRHSGMEGDSRGILAAINAQPAPVAANDATFQANRDVAVTIRSQPLFQPAPARASFNVQNASANAPEFAAPPAEMVSLVNH